MGVMQITVLESVSKRFEKNMKDAHPEIELTKKEGMMGYVLYEYEYSIDFKEAILYIIKGTYEEKITGKNFMS